MDAIEARNLSNEVNKNGLMTKVHRHVHRVLEKVKAGASRGAYEVVHSQIYEDIATQNLEDLSDKVTKDLEEKGFRVKSTLGTPRGEEPGLELRTVVSWDKKDGN
ncbi:hypothetical protein DRO66_00575 [Candidatus Bathyarchaeota archaeon]|nr:MAG: hypothetical protein DRO66_00575 [Candidatus Bathyarchaeota archaeon]